jgi:hypothetical protein
MVKKYNVIVWSKSIYPFKQCLLAIFFLASAFMSTFSLMIGSKIIGTMVLSTQETDNAGSAKFLNF